MLYTHDGQGTPQAAHGEAKLFRRMPPGHGHRPCHAFVNTDIAPQRNATSPMCRPLCRNATQNAYRSAEKHRRKQRIATVHQKCDAKRVPSRRKGAAGARSGPPQVSESTKLDAFRRDGMRFASIFRRTVSERTTRVSERTPQVAQPPYVETSCF